MKCTLSGNLATVLQIAISCLVAMRLISAHVHRVYRVFKIFFVNAERTHNLMIIRPSQKFPHFQYLDNPCFCCYGDDNTSYHTDRLYLWVFLFVL